MLLREHERLTFSEIGARYDLSDSRVCQIYWKAKIIQKKIYLREISEQIGNSVYREYMDIDERYNDLKIDIAYFEETYAHILDPFREGEPRSPYSTANAIKRPTHPRLCKSIRHTKIRRVLKSDELEIARELENGKSIFEIAALFDLSEKDAYYKVQTINMCRYRQLVKRVSEFRGIPYENLDRIFVHGFTLNEKIAFLEEWLKYPDAYDKYIWRQRIKQSARILKKWKGRNTGCGKSV